MRVDSLRGEVYYIGNDGEKDVLLCWLRDRDIYFFPEDSQQSEEWEEEQDYPEEDAANEDETSEIAESENLGRNIFSKWKANEKIRHKQIRLTESFMI